MENTAGGDPSSKTLHNSDVSGTRLNVPDVVVFGDGDTFQLICKASSVSKGWIKSTKACFVGQGCLVQVTTQQQNSDGSYAVAEALTYVPGVHVFENLDEAGNVVGRRLVETFGRPPSFQLAPEMDQSLAK